jgi:DNA-binding beta-propeller fold protein YncE
MIHRATASVVALGSAQAAPAPAPKPAPTGQQESKPSGPPTWRVLEKHKLGGEGSWDYLTFDPSAKRVFVSRSTHVMVVDAGTGAVVGDLADTAGVHGIAIAPDHGKAFTSNGRSANVGIFDLKTLKATGQAQTGEGPDAILFDPATDRVFTFNGRGQSVTAIDAASGTPVTPISTVALGGKPEAGVSDGAGKVFVNIEDKNEIVALDAETLSVLSRWSLAPGAEPTGLAIDVKTHRLFSACHNEKLVVLDSESGKVVTTVPIGKGVDGAAFDPGEGNVFTSNGDGTLTVVHEDAPDKYTVVANVPTQRGARTLALDPATHRVYLVTAELPAPPAPGSEPQRGRPSYLPDTFSLLVVGK